MNVHRGRHRASVRCTTGPGRAAGHCRARSGACS
jgi:hypothetical protein